MADCNRKNSDVIKKSSIISITITKKYIQNGSSFFLSREKVLSWIKKFSKNESSFIFKPGAKKSSYSKPYDMEFNWSIRPVDIIAPITRKNVILDRSIEVSVEIILRPLFKSNPDETLRYISSVSSNFSHSSTKKLDILIEETLKKCVAKTVSGLWFLDDINHSSPSKLIGLLNSEVFSIRKSVVNIIGKKKIKSAGPYLIKMLKKEKSENFRMRIAGVLGLLKERQAIEPLSEFALSLSDEHCLSILSVIASIGGEKAKTFLYWMSQGHENKSVREGAKKLLRSIEERKAKN